MEDILSKMAPDKKFRLINSALEEFSKNSYNKASTNTIVKKAQISKGLLYHYFRTKESLFDYLIVFSISIIAGEVLEKINWNEKNLINRIYEISVIKLKILKKYPYMANFSKVMYQDKNYDDVKAMIEKFVPKIYYEIYHKNIDLSVFKDDIDPKKAIKIIQWTIDKYSEELFNEYNYTDKEYDFDKIIVGLDSYLKMFEKMFYKEKFKNI